MSKNFGLIFLGALCLIFFLGAVYYHREAKEKQEAEIEINNLKDSLWCRNAYIDWMTKYIHSINEDNDSLQKEVLSIKNRQRDKAIDWSPIYCYPKNMRYVVIMDDTIVISHSHFAEGHVCSRNAINKPKDTLPLGITILQAKGFKNY